MVVSERQLTVRARARERGMRADLGLSVVGGGFIELFIQFKLDFGRFESALWLHADRPLLIQGDDKVRLGPVPYLTGGKTDTCKI